MANINLYGTEDPQMLIDILKCRAYDLTVELNQAQTREREMFNAIRQIAVVVGIKDENDYGDIDINQLMGRICEMKNIEDIANSNTTAAEEI